ncbi:MAG: DUF5698 domain-containing protein [Kiritimatiellae bacterium]|nr:DUF5698 domain-containing protein [Kiritimatiellia bacterium]
MSFDWNILMLGTVIFLARILDVSLGTLRIISVVQGRTWTAFFLGFFEVGIWITIISAVMHYINEQPILGFFYALGFAAGSVVGIKIERRIASGHIALRLISYEHGETMVEAIRRAGYGMTVYEGMGKHGPVRELFLVCLRKDRSAILKIAKSIDPDVFSTTSPADTYSRIYRPAASFSSGWQSLLKIR